MIHHTLRGVPLIWVQPLDKRGEPRGIPLVCADGTRMVGPGETIYYVASREAALTLDPPGPVDHAVVGIVDTCNLDDEPARSQDDKKGQKNFDTAVESSRGRGRKGGKRSGKGGDRR